MSLNVHTNFATSLVATAPSPAASGTSLVVTAGQGALFPAVPFKVAIWPAGTQPLSTNAEICSVTLVATDTFTIVRAQESTSARTVIVGDQIAAVWTAGMAKSSQGGGGSADVGLLVRYATAGEIVASTRLKICDAATPTLFSEFKPDFLQFNNIDGSGFAVSLQAPVPTANRDIFLPDAGGTVALNESSGVAKAWVNFDGTTATTTANVSGTYSRTSPSTTLTITVTAHGHIVGNVIYADFTTGTGLDGRYTVISVVDANTFTITTAASTTTSGNVTLLRKPINASFGVGSVTYLNAAGTFTINFSAAMTDANYVAPAGNAQVGGVAGFCLAATGGVHTTTAFDAVTVSIAVMTTAAQTSRAECVFFR